jgi:hypothetical protein
VHRDEEAEAYQIARELIATHGDGVAAFLQAKIDELVAAKNYAQLNTWFVIRNAVTLTLTSGTTLQ